MSYRIAETTDGIAVLALDEICFPEDLRVSLDAARWWLVKRGEKVVGYAGMRPCQLPHNRGVGFLCRVGILREHRGHGLQKRLIRVRERAARSLGLRELVTYTTPWNLASANSLIACGYRLYRPESRWGGAESLHWRRGLG
jgi:RimJ/RimL family protein N-acetyltransferase